MAFAVHRPATYELTGITEREMEAIRAGLLLVINEGQIGDDPTSQSYESFRLRLNAAKQVLTATNEAIADKKDQEEE